MNVLVVGRQQQVIDAAQRELGLPGVRVYGATTPARVTVALRARPIEHVFMGPGLDLDTRLDIVRRVFEESDTTCVHLKDHSRGPEGALDFVRGIIDGLSARYHSDA